MLLLFDTVIAVELLLKTNTFNTSTTNQQTTCSHQKKKTTTKPPNQSYLTCSYCDLFDHFCVCFRLKPPRKNQIKKSKPKNVINGEIAIN